VIDPADLTDEALEALEVGTRRRCAALADRIELEAREHPVSRAPARAFELAGDVARLRALEARLALAERVCELAEYFDLRATGPDQRYVDALCNALAAWRAAKEEPCPNPSA
jgi:hypothetical protein